MTGPRTSPTRADEEDQEEKEDGDGEGGEKHLMWSRGKGAIRRGQPGLPSLREGRGTGEGGVRKQPR